MSWDDHAISPFETRGDQRKAKGIQPARQADAVGGAAVLGKYLFELGDGRPVPESAGRDQGGNVAQDGLRQISMGGLKIQKGDDDRGSKGRLAHSRYTLVVRAPA